MGDNTIFDELQTSIQSTRGTYIPAWNKIAIKTASIYLDDDDDDYDYDDYDDDDYDDDDDDYDGDDDYDDDSDSDDDDDDVDGDDDYDDDGDDGKVIEKIIPENSSHFLLNFKIFIN